MRKPCKVLCLFDYKSFTGFSSVSTNIVRELKKYFGEDLKLDICAINYFGEPMDDEYGNYVISAKKSASKQDDFGRFGFLKILKDSNEYDGVFIIQDLGVICPIAGIIKHLYNEKLQNKQKTFKSIFYFPVDCHIVEKLTDGLDSFDLIITYNEYGRNEVLKHKPELKNKIKVIPHGNNFRDFYPIDEKEIKSFRDEYFGKNSNKFIITNVNRNQPRKDIPTTIFGFSEAKKTWKEQGLTSEPFLYLHMHPKDPMGWDIRAIFLQTDLVENEDYQLLTNEIANNGASIDMLNKIYNSSDVYLTTTLGEGWGLTMSEAMATKTPIICPLTTSFIEMTNNGKNAYTLKNIIPFCGIVDNVIREQCDMYEIADKIIEVAKTKQGLLGQDAINTMHEKLENSHKWISSLDWKSVCKRWIEYFKSTY
jgi:glycosyltransferase involved in cell wall biosynthesis